MNGLDGVVVAETTLSHVDGAGGELVVAGKRLGELAGATGVAGVAALLWGDEVTEAQLGAARLRAFDRVLEQLDCLEHESAMSALQSASALLPSTATFADIAASMAVIAAAWHRHRLKLAVVAPDPELDHGGDYLRMMRGEAPNSAEARAITRYLVTVADHGINASTFAARVVASTGADAPAAIAAAIGALSGPLHGGAPGPVLDMLDAAGEQPRPWIESEIAAGRRIMGMGHRVYRARDPRAAVLETAAGELEAAGHRTRLAAARTLESAARDVLADRYRDRALCANVELYTAVLLDALGLPREQFSATFAVGRVIGWLGHIGEQRAKGRLIRPASRYVGRLPGA